MISNRQTRRGFCHTAILAILAPAPKRRLAHKSPKPRYEIGDYVKTERPYDERVSDNFDGTDWESGFISGYVWQYDEWVWESYRHTESNLTMPAISILSISIG